MVVYQDTSQDLRSPLVWNSFQTRCIDGLFQEFFWIFYISKVTIESFSTVTIRTSSNHDDRSAFFVWSFSSCHPFNGLVDVLVKWETTVCWNRNVAFDLRHVCQVCNKFTTNFVGFNHVPSERSDDVFFAVQDNIDDEGQFCSTSSVKHIFVDWVVVKVTSTCFIRVEEVTWVVRHDSLVWSNTWKDWFTSTWESSKEVRFDESFC